MIGLIFFVSLLIGFVTAIIFNGNDLVVGFTLIASAIFYIGYQISEVVDKLEDISDKIGKEEE